LGLGGISEKIGGIIKTVRTPIDKAIDWLIAQAVKFAKKIGKAIGFGKDKDKGKENKDSKDGKLKDGEVGKTINFSAKGESHRLWVQVQGEKSVVMVASNPTPVAAFLDQPSVKALEKSEGKEKVQNARELAKKVNLDAQQILQYIRVEKYQEAAKEDDEIEKEQKQLLDGLKWIFDHLDGDGKLASEKTLVKSRVGELEGRAVRLLKAIGYDSDKYGHLAEPINKIKNNRLKKIEKEIDTEAESREELKILEEDLTNVDEELKSYENLLQDSIKKREELDAAVETDKDQWKDKERWERTKAQVQQILENYKSRILAAVPGASVKFRGSLATGWKGPHKVDKETGAAKRFDPSNFDCDAYVELTDKMWVEELAQTGLVPRGQNWAWLKDIRRWRRTAELEQVQIEIKQQLKGVEGYKQEAGEPDFKMSLQSQSEGIQKLLEGTAYPQGAFEKAGAGEIEKRMPSGRTRDDNRPGRRMMESSEEV
jgi:F0F1-type ATP synthase membrane subunit b/b'